MKYESSPSLIPYALCEWQDWAFQLVLTQITGNPLLVLLAALKFGLVLPDRGHEILSTGDELEMPIGMITEQCQVA